MARLKGVDKLEALRRTAAQIQAQIQAEEAKTKERERKEDTRRKVIAGALALEHMQKNGTSEFAKTMTRLLDEYVIRPQDRTLFDGLPPKASTTPPGRRTANPSEAGTAEHVSAAN
jgi:hypothetical protein